MKLGGSRNEEVVEMKRFFFFAEAFTRSSYNVANFIIYVRQTFRMFPVHLNFEMSHRKSQL